MNGQDWRKIEEVLGDLVDEWALIGANDHVYLPATEANEVARDLDKRLRASGFQIVETGTPLFRTVGTS